MVHGLGSGVWGFEGFAGCGDLRGLGLSFRKGLRCLRDLGGFRILNSMVSINNGARNGDLQTKVSQLAN